MCLFFLVSRYSFIVYRYANVYLILILQKKNEKKLSKNNKFYLFFEFPLYLCHVKSRHDTMEPEKVIRIVSLFLLIAAFAIHVATRLMFPEAPNHTLSIIVLCMLAAGNAISDRGSRRRAGNDRQ